MCLVVIDNLSSVSFNRDEGIVGVIKVRLNLFLRYSTGSEKRFSMFTVDNFLRLFSERIQLPPKETISTLHLSRKISDGNSFLNCPKIC